MGYYSDTELSFYDDPYKTKESVFIDQYDPTNQYLILNKTIFYPQGGGQKGDRGKIIISESGLEIVISNTTKKDGIIFHHLANPIEEGIALNGEKAEMNLDWDFRYIQMKLHCLAHLIHFFIEKELDIELPMPKTADLQDGFGFNVYEMKDAFDQEAIKLVEKKLNEFISESHEIKTYPDPLKPGYRYWECEDMKVGCGGTHPKNTKEIGRVSMEVSKKGETTRVNFRLI